MIPAGGLTGFYGERDTCSIIDDQLRNSLEWHRQSYTVLAELDGTGQVRRYPPS